MFDGPELPLRRRHFGRQFGRHQSRRIELAEQPRHTNLPIDTCLVYGGLNVKTQVFVLNYYYYVSLHYQITLKIKPLYLTHYTYYMASGTI
jgi:hypothetical protein